MLHGKTDFCISYEALLLSNLGKSSILWPDDPPRFADIDSVDMIPFLIKTAVKTAVRDECKSLKKSLCIDMPVELIHKEFNEETAVLHLSFSFYMSD
jgi:hypothetical protein